MTAILTPQPPILADYTICELTPRERKRFADGLYPSVVATVGGMSRRLPVTLADLREFQGELAAYIAYLEQGR